MESIKALQDLASEMVGDGQEPNMFFVSKQGVVVMVVDDFYAARNYWHGLLFENVECCVEDRLWGVIASKEPRSDTDPKLILWDDSEEFQARYSTGGL